VFNTKYFAGKLVAISRKKKFHNKICRSYGKNFKTKLAENMSFFSRLTQMKKLIGSNWRTRREDHCYGLISSIRRTKKENT